MHALVEDDLDGALRSFAALVGADSVELANPGLSYNDVVLVGPRYSEQARAAIAQRAGRETIDDVVFDLGDQGDHPDAPTCILAWAVFRVPGPTDLRTPLVYQHRMIPALSDVPVLIAESAMPFGELICVPETSEVFVSITDIDQGVNGLQWFALRGPSRFRRPPRKPVRRPGPRDPAGSVREVAAKALSSALFGPAESTDTIDIGGSRGSAQVWPVLAPEEHDLLAAQLPNGPWLRRQGEIYTQDSLDLVRWVQSPGGPKKLKPIVDRLQSNALIARLGRMTGRPLERSWEIYAYRLRLGERILVHADSTEHGQLDVRINWLVSCPESRVLDMRFWDPNDESVPALGFRARPNHAIFFRVGEANPHDVPPVTGPSTAFRYNVVMTFGQFSRQ